MPSTTNFGWTTPADTDLVKDGAAAIRTLGNGVDASFVDLKGGTTGQVLSKNSNTDLDFAWVAQDDSNAIQNAIVDAKGDLIAATAADTPARLAVGTNGQVLTADSTTSTGLKWAAAGKLLQVINATYSTVSSTTSATYSDTGLTATITPSSVSSKVLVFVTHSGVGVSGNTYGRIKLLRGATDISNIDTFIGYQAPETSELYIGSVALNYLDSPATTSATTYKTQFAETSDQTFYINQTAGGLSTVSTITLMEIGA